jgi:6-phosphogluconate dehydrogenase
MNVGIVGLGKMGFAIAVRLLNAGHEVIGLDHSDEIKKKAAEIGVDVVDSIEQLAQKTSTVWLMVPVSQVDTVIRDIKPHLKAGNIVVDGGNSFYKDSQRREQELAHDGIFYLDCGTSGGIEGEGRGFCLMVGGDEASYTKIHPLLAAIAAPGGMGHIGPSGAGHYVKTVHNGIEYGLMEAYAEGLHLIKDGAFKKNAIDLEELTRVWQVSSVIRSFLLELTHRVMAKDQELHDVSGEVAEGGTGKWTVEQAHESDIPVPVIEAALKVREWSRKTGGNYATKLLAMMRHEFGGHAVKKIKE